MTRPPRSPYGAHWQLSPDVTFLNNGSFGACPTVVLEEQNRLRAILELDPMAFFLELGPGLWKEAREALSIFLNADPEGMTFQTNASAGVNTVVRSLPFREGDEILVLDHAYQACRNAIEYACKRSGARAVVVRLPFPPESEDQVVALVLGAATDRTRLAMFDTVTSPTGIRLPFERLTHELQGRGIDVLVDGAHGAGIVPIDLKSLGAAYFAGQCHKWLCTPKGSGFLHIREDRRHLIEPLTISHGYSAPVTQTERFRLEFDWQGTLDPTPWLCIPKALDFVGGLLPGGWDEIMARNRGLALRARDILADALELDARVPPSMLAAMATLQIPEDPGATFTTALAGDALMRTLYSEYGIRVVVFAWPQHRSRYLRVSAALYNSEDEYRYLADMLRKLGIRSNRVR